MASRKTNFTVYVDKELMTKPSELVDAVLAHMIKKDLDIKKRKQFLVGFMRITDDKAQLEFINEWVLVRDVATFPFRYNKKAGAKTDENTEVEGGVPVDNGTDGEKESGTSSE